MYERGKSPSIRGVIGRGALAASVVAGLAVLAGCSPAVPENPTWTEDVRPILMANCARCHSDPPLRGAPGLVRLDRHDNWPDGNGGVLLGAAASAEQIAARAADNERPMPPEFGPLDPRQQEILQLWYDSGAPRGEPLPDNEAPSVTIQPPVIDAGAQTATIDYELTDAEGDFVVGRMDAVLNATEAVVAASLARGVGQVVWSFAGLDAGSYALSATLDDGSSLVAIDLGTIDVPPAADIPGAGRL